MEKNPSLVPDNTSTKPPTAAVNIILVLMIWAVFGLTLNHGFVDYDDGLYVAENSIVKRGVTWDGIVQIFGHPAAYNYHPLTMLSHMLDCQLWGLRPGMHHLTSVLLHTANVLLLFALLRRMTGAFWRCAFVAAVFAIHPLRVESVAWIAERKDVLSGLFFMLTLWCYTRFVEDRKKIPLRDCESIPDQTGFLRSSWYWLAVLCYLMGLLSKPMLVTMPFVLLLIDRWPLERWGTGSSLNSLIRLLLEKTPFLLLSLLDCAVTVATQQAAINPMESLSLPARVSNMLTSYVVYLRQMFWPVDLIPFYPHVTAGSGHWWPAVAGLILLAITCKALFSWRNAPWLGVGWLWYLGMLVPVIGLMQVGRQAHADRYTYLPQIGIYLMLTWGIAGAFAGWHWRKKLLGPVAAVAIIALMIVAHQQTEKWRDSVSLWKHALKHGPENIVAYENLTYALIQTGQIDDAEKICRRVLEQVPDEAEMLLNLSQIYSLQKKWPESSAAAEKALRLKPGNATAHFNLGIALMAQGRLTEAVQQYQKALAAKPDYPECHVNLGQAYVLQGQLPLAAEEYRKALRLDPNQAVAQFKLGEILSAQGNHAEAMAAYSAVIQAQPDYAEARLNLGNLLMDARRVQEAAAQYSQAVQTKPGLADAHFNLGNALYSLGLKPEAATEYATTLKLRPDMIEARLNLGIVYAAMGRNPEALLQFQEMAKLARAQNQAALEKVAEDKIRSVSTLTNQNYF